MFVSDAGLEVEVKDPPKGMIPPGTQMVKPKAEPQPSKVRGLFSLTDTGMNVHVNTPVQCMCACRSITHLRDTVPLSSTQLF